MASRGYAIKSHKYNLEIGENVVLAKFKPNLEYDLNFFDDEEVKIIIKNFQKDWTDIAWYHNKCIKSKVTKIKDEIEVIPLSDTV